MTETGSQTDWGAELNNTLFQGITNTLLVAEDDEDLESKPPTKQHEIFQVHPVPVPKRGLLTTGSEKYFSTLKAGDCLPSSKVTEDLARRSAVHPYRNHQGLEALV